MSDKLRVALLMGGPSSEHEVSLASGGVVAKELDSDRYEIIPVVINKKGEWSIDADKLAEDADIAFVALHGEYGEDGTVQGILKDIGLPYTGSDVLSSALAMNKILSSRLFRARGMNTPEFIHLRRHEKNDRIFFDFDLPVVIKPADRGSSVGVSIARDVKGIEEGLDSAFRFSEDVIIQEYISGREVQCAVIDDGVGDVVPFPPTEIIPKAGSFFDYHAKYTPGVSEEITPARFSKKGIELVQETAVAAHKAVGASGMSRTDMIIADDETVYIIEINTIPGMTQTSLLPQGAEAYGLTLSELFERIIEAGLRRHGLLLRDI